MSRPATTIFVFGIYILLIGVSFLFVPNVVLSIFGLPLTQEVWIRVLGLLAAALSLYYFQAARHELTPFFEAAVWGRGLFVVGLIALALLQVGSMTLILFAGVDLLGLLWTAWALRSQPARVTKTT